MHIPYRIETCELNELRPHSCKLVSCSHFVELVSLKQILYAIPTVVLKKAEKDDILLSPDQYKPRDIGLFAKNEVLWRKFLQKVLLA